MNDFNVCISEHAYTHKPMPVEISKMKFTQLSLSTDEFINKILEGYSYTALMKDNHRCKDNFICSNFIVFDIDHCDTPMEEYVPALNVLPTFCYTTPSNTEGDYGFRLVYLLDFDICSVDDYYYYSRSFAQQLGLRFCDGRSFLGEQYWNGSTGAGVIVYNTILNKLNFILNNDYIKRTSTGSNSKSASSSISYLNSQYITSCTFENDYRSLRYNDIISKYIDTFQIIQHTPVEMNEDEPIIYYPDNYCEITYPWKKNNGNLIKIGDGMGRRRKLFIYGIIIKKIKPDISFDELLYNLVYNFENYFLNNGNIITKKIIYDIAVDVMKADISNYNDLGKPQHKFFVNPLYCEKYNLKKMDVLAGMKNKKQYIGEFYDPSLTDQQNIDTMKKYGLDVSLRTLKTWKKENNIKKYEKC